MADNIKNRLKRQNIQYVSRDFVDLRNSLVNYAKQYFPNTYKDFNETSPGMMLMEMSAYVGDVLNFYIDQQYREMMLPLAQERKNVIQMARMLGYKTKPTRASSCYLTFTATVPAKDVSGGSKTQMAPNYSFAPTYNQGIVVSSTSDSTIKFETFGAIDFTISSSQYEPREKEYDSDGIVSSYTLQRDVKALSCERKEKSFYIGSAQPFRRLQLPETDVIDIVNVIDSNGNIWYEVDYLAEDTVFTEKHYTDDWENATATSDSERVNAYTDFEGNTMAVPVPYAMSHLKSTKRFIVEVDEENRTHLVFGSGLIRTGVSGSFDTSILQTDQIGITLPGEPTLNSSINPYLADAGDNLGEAPTNTTLTVTYRVGGGISSNVGVGTLENVDSKTLVGGSEPSSLSVTNKNPARGGGLSETVSEIRHNARAFFSTQNRCVTKEDYEARVLNMPAKFGKISKVYCKRNTIDRLGDTSLINFDKISEMMQILWNNYNNEDGLSLPAAALSDLEATMDIRQGDGGITQSDVDTLRTITEALKVETAAENKLAGVEIFVLSELNDGSLTNTTNVIKHNLKKYLSLFRIITDEIKISDGFIINFGVMFDVVAQRNISKDVVKVNCIEIIKEYFNKVGMHFRQPINVGDLLYLLQGVNGVRSVNDVQITQGWDYTEDQTLFAPQGLYSYDSLNPGGGATNNSAYWWKYDFVQAKQGTLILPSIEPAVFELKNPNTNIKGVVR